MGSIDSYSTGWIAPIFAERAAALAVLDEHHDEPENFDQHPSDKNAYSWGRMGKHNIVIASLPDGIQGVVSAAVTVSNLLASLPDIKIGLLVGIGGGVPSLDNDIRLGDIVVSRPSSGSGGVIQYDFVKAKVDNQFEPKGVLNNPPSVLLNALAKLRAHHMIKPSRIPAILEAMWEANPLTKKPRKGGPGFVHQGFDNDRLFSPECIHAGGENCDDCEASKEVQRDARDTTDPEIHYGIIASGNALVKDAVFRDEIAKACGKDCFCVEMEAAALMNNFPCLVIRGICDYADSHKNDRWQPYASATAAAFAKELLEHVPIPQLQKTPGFRALQSSVQEIKSEVSQVLGQVENLRDVVVETFQKPQVNQCLRDLRGTDPRMDKKRIEETKGGLMTDLYDWVLENEQFLQFRHTPSSNLLWIRGDPGKGKTMLMCGIINELLGSPDHSVVYFFCQETDPNLNSATSVIRGIILLLVLRHPSLLHYLQTEYDKYGTQLSEGNNAWFCLKGIFENMIQSPDWEETFVMVDALDECVSGRAELLDMIVQLSTFAKIKWIISSRNSRDIEEKLHVPELSLQLRLELNDESISKAVDVFIAHKTKKLVLAKGYSEQTESEVKTYLLDNSSGTFLWVAVVYDELLQVEEWDVMETLRTFPPGLDDLYGRMMERMCDKKSSEKCKEVLAIATLAYQPLNLAELKILSLSIKSFRMQQLKRIVGLCGSFLTIREDVVYFIHQSAKEYLLKDNGNHIFPLGISQQHWSMFLRSAESLCATLEENPYKVQHMGTLATEIAIPDPDPLVSIRYSCAYWVEHLNNSEVYSHNGNALADGGIIDSFMRRKYLHWLESLSLVGALAKGVRAISTLKVLIQTTRAPELSKLLDDADCFLRYFKVACEKAPMQIYLAGRVFSPKNSEIRQLFFNDSKISRFAFRSPMNNTWGSCLQTLEGHGSHVSSLALSPDSSKLASASVDETKIWDFSTGSCIKDIEELSMKVLSMAFTPGGIKVLSSIGQGILIWDSTTDSKQRFETQGIVTSGAFSLDKGCFALGIDNDVEMWNSESYIRQYAFKGHSDNVIALEFSQNGESLASASADATIIIWSTRGSCQQILRGHSDIVRAILFYHNDENLVSGSRDGTIRIWSLSTGSCLQILTDGDGHGKSVRALALLRDSDILASGFWDGTIKIWNLATGTCLNTITGHRDQIHALVFAPSHEYLISGSADKTIKVWDYKAETNTQVPEFHGDVVSCIDFSADRKRIVSGSLDMTIKVWDISKGICTKTFYGHKHEITSVAFSPNGCMVASGSHDYTVKIWDTTTGTCLRTLLLHNDWVESVVFSFDNARLVTGAPGRIIKLWDVDSGSCLKTFQGPVGVKSVAFSSNGQTIASSCEDGEVRIWDTSTGSCLQVLGSHSSTSDAAMDADMKSDVDSGVESDMDFEIDSNFDPNLDPDFDPDFEYHTWSVKFSPDDTTVACISPGLAKSVNIWDIATGTCLQTFAGQFANVEWVDVWSNSQTPSTPTQSRTVQAVLAEPSSWSISTYREWLLLDRKPFLWLPTEYRPTAFLTDGALIAWGCNSGRVLFIDTASSVARPGTVFT